VRASRSSAPSVGVRGLDRGERAALLINECQNGMIHVDYANHAGLATEVARRGVVARIAALLETCRDLGVLVVHSTIVLRPDGIGSEASCLLLGSLMKTAAVVEGRVEAEIHAELTPIDTDVVSQRRHGLSPFHGTELEAMLRQQQVQTVIVAGVSTNIGIPGACLEAVNRGFRAVVPADCVAGAWPEAQEFQVTHTLPLLATVTTSDEVIAVLRAGGPTPAPR
jgi:nicotinamidase-related amidase